MYERMKQPIQVTNNSNYIYNSLNEEDGSISEWSEFCAQCFAYKPNAPDAAYFQRHFYNDPQKDASLIHVLRHYHDSTADTLSHNHNSIAHPRQPPEMVSSVRVFQRSISLGSRSSSLLSSLSPWKESSSLTPSLSAGGIGEVCTHANHQRKGLAKRLLSIALESIKERAMSLSLLHVSSAALAKFYHDSAGYQSVVSYWSVVPFWFPPLEHSNVNPTKIFLSSTNPIHIHVRKAIFPQDTMLMQQIHQEYSQSRLVGCIIRTADYWNHYLSREIGDSLFVLELSQLATTRTRTSATDTNADTDTDTNADTNVDTNPFSTINHTPTDTYTSVGIVAWMSLKKKSHQRFQLQDFGIVHDSVLASFQLTNTQVFEMLLQTSMTKINISNVVVEQEPSRLELHLPTFVLNELQQSQCKNYDTQNQRQNQMIDIDWNSHMIYSDDDHGWMYKVMNQNSNDKYVENTDLDNNIFQLIDMGKTHLIWPSDSF